MNGIKSREIRKTAKYIIFALAIYLILSDIQVEVAVIFGDIPNWAIGSVILAAYLYYFKHK